MYTDVKFKQTLLITEDIFSNFYVLEATVGRNFNKVLHAKNGIEAVEYCKSNNDIGIVLMDISMPDMNGFEATKIIKSYRPDIPVIALTAYITDDLEEKLAEAGCIDYLLKPFQYETLLMKITEYLSARSH
ncbi:MAG: response regulator [Lentimicrobium sp.]|nr:response regulator [Lentimicrobium sp.]